jgi:hypothetical protein
MRRVHDPAFSTETHLAPYQTAEEYTEAHPHGLSGSGVFTAVKVPSPGGLVSAAAFRRPNDRLLQGSAGASVRQTRSH